MCIGRDLKPMECPTTDNKQCRDVVIPRLHFSLKDLTLSKDPHIVDVDVMETEVRHKC